MYIISWIIWLPMYIISWIIWPFKAIYGLIAGATATSTATNHLFLDISGGGEEYVTADQIASFMTRSNDGYKHECPITPSEAEAARVASDMVIAKKARCLELCRYLAGELRILQ